MSNINLSSIPQSLFWRLDEKARRRWDSLSLDEQAHEIEKAKHEELAWKENPVREWWCDQFVTPIAAMQWWMQQLFDRTLSSHELTAYCCAEHGMTITQAQSMPIPEIVDLLKAAYEKNVDFERKAAENPEPGLVEKPEAKKDDDKSADSVEQTSPVARAMVLMYDHKNRFGKLMTVNKILEMIPDTNRAALYRDKNFVAAREAIKESLQMKPPSGFKNIDGEMDARAEDDDDDDDNDSD